MVVSARAIVIGEVSDISTGVQNDRVYSYIRLKVEEVIKGKNISSEVVLKQPGGEYGDLGTLIFGMPKFEVGKKVLVYLDSWADGALRVHQMFLGKFDITKDASTNQFFVTRDQGENVQLFTRANTASTRRAELNTFKSRLWNLYESNFSRAEKFEEETYGDLPMLAEPLEFASLRQRGQISPMWVTLNPPQPPRWFEPDSGQSIAYYVNRDGAPSPIVVDDVDAALRAWTEGTTLRFHLGGETSACQAGVNGSITVVFNNCDGSFSRSDGCSGILGVGGISKYLPSQSKSVNGMTFYKSLEGMVSLNPYGLCNVMNRCDLQETLTHELGHALGLGHTTDEIATMWPITHFDNRCNSLLGDDIQGIRFMYGSTGGALNITTGTDLLPATVNFPYATKLDATGGSGTQTWQLTGGRLPSGLQLSSNGTLYGLTFEVGTYNFSVQVRDTSGRSAQASFNLSVQAATPVPEISEVIYKKKKVIVTGQNFAPSGALYINDRQRFATFTSDKIQTDKGKLKVGTYTVYVVNPDNKVSNRFTLVIQ
ncbi:MAG: matrixin family metalloprotease [Acidobacteriota bacterium]